MMCMDAAAELRVVLVHDWLTGMRGGEKCLEVLCRHFPHAPLYNLLHQRGSVSEAIERLKPRCSFLQYFPRVHQYYRYLLPLMPLAARWRLPACDVVVSLSHCVAKSASPPPGVPHVCYCFTPMRYAWHLRDAYFGPRVPGVSRRLFEMCLNRLRAWDRQTAARVSHFVAISRTVQERIRTSYGRDSLVIYPPVDTDFFCPAPIPREDYYLVLSALVPYKRLELAIAACNRLQRRLVVIGSGPEEKRLRALAGPTVQFLGWQPGPVVREQLRRCRALLFPGEEDFGIVPLEAQACGTPVIAFGRGGATETVVPLRRRHADDATGLWFEEQTVACVIEAIAAFEQHADELMPEAARRQALRFNAQRFAAEIVAFLAGVCQRHSITDELPEVSRVTNEITRQVETAESLFSRDALFVGPARENRKTIAECL
jgi:glycosyltransferase involved in cell wall biosynthesis